MAELADFVLNYCRRAEALIEPAPDGVYDVLLPDALAAQWRVPALQRWVFGETVQARPGVTTLGYGHPLVEQIVETVRNETLCGWLYINQVRLDKTGLIDLARAAIGLPNARLVEAPRQVEARLMCHYVRFNYKVALVTDEKREQLVSVMMDAQAGHVVKELARIEELSPLEAEPQFKQLTPAPLRWRQETDPLSRAALQGLLERAQQAALDELAPQIAGLGRHAARYLELDRARLNEYYDGMERDLGRRAGRAADEDKRASVESKLEAVRHERQAKLADVEAKYQLRVEMELLNALVIGQPKIARVVHIENRTTTVARMVVWDPLLHRIEPLVCDACGLPGARLFLCSGGHLAHEECLAPQCVDCKRVFCTRCESKVSACAVCERPVCVHSLNRCGECGRGTCREHMGLCHAADGQPAKIVRSEPGAQLDPPPEPPKPGPKLDQPRLSSLQRKKQERERQAAHQAAQEAAARRRKAYEPMPAATGDRIEVLIASHAALVSAAVFASGRHPIAIRTWKLVEDGVLTECQCEKRACPADNMIFAPPDAAHIEGEIAYQLDLFRREYDVPPRRVAIYQDANGNSLPLPRLALRGRWKDAETLAAAREKFRQTYVRV